MYKRNTYEKDISVNTNIECNTPVLFAKKRKKYIVKPLTYIESDTGITRHFTPAAQEWFNSVYSYDYNKIKSLPIADVNLVNILKSYFNFQISRKIIKKKYVAYRYIRSFTKKIFVGRGDLKHTSSKLIITFYVFNTEKKFLFRAIRLLFKALYYPKRELKKTITINKYKKEIISYNRTLSLKEYLNLPEHMNKWYIKYVTPYVELKNLYLNNIILQHKILKKLVNLNTITEDEFSKIFLNLCENIHLYNHPKFSYYIIKARKYYLSGFFRLFYLLKFNKIKFTKEFISKLTSLVQKMYQKKVEFNIVNLKKMHLNSDIYTQAVSLKLRERDNRLYRVLKASLRKVKLPNFSRLLEKYNKNKKNLNTFVNRIRNKTISSMLTRNKVKDPLSKLLFDFFPSPVNLKVKKIKKSYTKERSISLMSYVFKTLKPLKIRGVRIEAKGRLTRRHTASRSVFKMKWKGGLKNVDSSFKGLSATLLRGHLKSNVQYSFVNSKNRNGAFGVKGWVSNR